MAEVSQDYNDNETTHDFHIKIELEDNYNDNDTNDREVSDDMADACKTYCQICQKVFLLSSMRLHTKKAHQLQITQYKQIYGNFDKDESLIIKMVYHKCHICGKIVLLDNDRLGAHVKSIHKMKEKNYKDLYMIPTPRKVKTTHQKNDKEFDVNEDHLKVLSQRQINVDNEESLPTYNEIGMIRESSSAMTGVKKVGGKLKPSSRILGKSGKRPMQDTFMVEEEDYDERSSNTVRRPKRNVKQPYWRKVDAKNNEMAAKQIDEPDGMQHKRVKSKSGYRKVKVKTNGQKSDEKEAQNTSVFCPSLSRSKNDLDEHTSRGPSMEISPKLQMRSRGSNTDFNENEETRQNSNSVDRLGLAKANLKKPGTKSDNTDCVIVKEEPVSENPREWTVVQTVAAIIRADPSIDPEDIKAIRDHKIDGKALLELSFDELVK